MPIILIVWILPIEHLPPILQTTVFPMPSIDNNFSVPPFPSFPSVTRFLDIGSVSDTLQRLGRSITAREAIALVIGPPGVGKSLIALTIAARFAQSHDVVVLNDTSIEDRSALLRHLLHHLGVDNVAGPANDLHLALVDRVSQTTNDKDGLLLVVDEAQSLDPDVLEAIRMVTNIMKDGIRVVSAVICGGVKLDETLTSSAMEAFNQRVATRCYLHPMSLDETRYYIHGIIGQCGADPATTITDDAISAVHHGCNGVPRLVNQLMTQAIDVAAERDQVLICEAVVDAAWAVLQQLPSPMVEEPKIAGSSAASVDDTAVEFGELSDLSSTAASIERSTHPIASQPEMMEADDVTFGALDSKNSHDEELALAPEITIESPSAAWVDDEELTIAEEPVAAGTPEPEAHKAPAAASLFGQFDDEEELAVGMPTHRPAAVSTPSPINEAPGNRAEASGNRATSLETSLHQEIVGMTSHDTTIEIGADHDHYVLPAAMESLSCSHEQTFEFLEETPVAETEDRPSLRFVNVESEPSAQPSHEEAVDDDITLSTEHSQDDRDLLVIEDDLEFEAEEAGISEASYAEVPEEGRPVTVDFQAMLSRMRTGT